MYIKYPLKLDASTASVSQTKAFSEEQLKARERALKCMKKGLDLKGAVFNRDDLHKR